MSLVIIFTAQARKMLDSAMQPGAAQKALSMQVESFWQRHGNKVLGLGAVVLLYVLWYAAVFHTSWHHLHLLYTARNEGSSPKHCELTSSTCIVMLASSQASQA